MISLREGRRDDAAPLTALFLASRAAAMPYLPLLHTEASTQAWMEATVLTQGKVLAAEVAGELAGFAALAGDHLDHLYVAPASQGRGVGRRLLAAAKAASPRGLDLLVFQRNARARAFYERSGFRLIELRDGAENEEREPDALYRWRPGAHEGLS